MGKRVVMVVAPDKFRDEELFQTKEVLENNNIDVVVASVKMKEITGMMGRTIVPDFELKDVPVVGYDAIVFIGGSGAEFYFKHTLAHKLVKEFSVQGKLVSAICIAPCILANAGLLKGKKATVFRGSKYELTLRDGGAALQRDHVVVDGK
ncbi:MAG: hypothetical protein GOV15_03670, partial [Candidatus Diapherotrites archaeon]|nr:hypothetical protein [Candidatus Diapherotrites archaeon]